MTIFGPDISSFQHGLNLASLSEADFVIAKTTEGTYYTDADYEGWRLQAAALHKPFLWYHFLSGEDAHAQAAHTAANVGDGELPGMLDAEPEGSFNPTLAQILAYIDAAHDAAHDAGLNLRLVYLPHWYWQQMGSPDLTPIAARGVHLVSSAYPGGSGSPAALYPGDGAAGWAGYGGMAPLLYQFTNKASDGGQPLDYNAFRGQVADLHAALYPTVTPSSTEDNMPAFGTGTIAPGMGPDGKGACTVVLPPPANFGAAGWGNVWFSLGSDFADAHVRITLFQGGVWKDFNVNYVVPAASARVQPFGAPLPTDVEKISITRLAGSENVPLAYLIEAVAR